MCVCVCVFFFHFFFFIFFFVIVSLATFLLLTIPVQFARAVLHRMKGVRVSVPNHVETWKLVVDSTKNHFETLRNAHNGRCPNSVRAGMQAVAVSVCNKVPRGQLKAVASETSCSCGQLTKARKKWRQVVEGDVVDLEKLIELKGKTRSDAMSDEHADFVVSVWNDNTRASERAKDSIRNPRERRDQVSSVLVVVVIFFTFFFFRMQSCMECTGSR